MATTNDPTGCPNGNDNGETMLTGSMLLVAQQLLAKSGQMHKITNLSEINWLNSAGGLSVLQDIGQITGTAIRRITEADLKSIPIDNNVRYSDWIADRQCLMARYEDFIGKLKLGDQGATITDVRYLLRVDNYN